MNSALVSELHSPNHCEPCLDPLPGVLPVVPVTSNQSIPSPRARAPVTSPEQSTGGDVQTIPVSPPMVPTTLKIEKIEGDS